MLFFERLTRLLFALLFGWVLVLLAAETRWRRSRRRREDALERAFAARPSLRPTVAVPHR